MPAETTMKLDSNRAWKEASRNVSRNREPLLAVAGVFFLLPQLVLSLFFPQPEQTAGMNQQQVIAMVQDYYVATLPAIIPLVLCQALGTLALLSLLRHAGRPTVGEALRLGLAGVLSYLGAQILLGMALGIAGGTVLAILAMSGIPALAVAGLGLMLVLAIAIGVRVSLSAAVVAIDGERNPWRALRRSWEITAGNGARLLGFYALFMIAFIVIQIIVELVVGIPLTFVGRDNSIANTIAALVTSATNTLVAVYLVGIVGAVHAQLTGAPSDQERRVFE
jgi:hypothetical protein